MKTLFAGDLHLGHSNITKFRTMFSSSEEHDMVIYENILRELTKRTTLYLLGDICFTLNSLSYIQGFVETGAKVVLVGGNHCTDNLTMAQLVKVYSQLFFYANRHGFTLSHMPIHPDHLRGKLNVHAHLHSQRIEQDSRYLCVSLEQTEYKPISLEAVRDIFHSRIIDGSLSPSYLPALKL